MTYDARPVNSFSNSHRVTRFLLPALPESTAAEPFRVLQVGDTLITPLR